jgi:hypothetical protein
MKRSDSLMSHSRSFCVIPSLTVGPVAQKSPVHSIDIANIIPAYGSFVSVGGDTTGVPQTVWLAQLTCSSSNQAGRVEPSRLIPTPPAARPDRGGGPVGLTREAR